jgi:NMD protein affecting ribosome stability and mRNA decay
MPSVRMIDCLLCGQTKPHKSRNLCLACYQKPESEPLKIETRHRVERNTNAFMEPLGLPDHPTEFLPGSEEKMMVMAQRLEDLREIHHPDDAMVTPDCYHKADGSMKKRKGVLSHNWSAKKITLDIPEDETIDF